MKTKADKGALLALLSVICIYALSFVGVEYCTAHMSTMLIATVRLTIAGSILLIFCCIRYKGLHFEKKDAIKIICIGAFIMGGYMNFQSYGIRQISSPMTSLILAVVPVLGLLADRIFNGVKITGAKVIAIVGSIVGVALLVLTTGEALKGSATGVIAIFICAVLWASYIILTKDIFNKYNLVQVMALIQLSAAAMSLPAVFVFDKPIFMEPDPVLFGALLGTALISSIAAELLYAYSISKLSVTIVSMAENMLPLVTVLFAWLLLGTTLNVYQIIGGLIIIGSVTVITVKE
ncbi:MAG: DMT family transporter [Bacillota bacterium]|nr:DMT family transporter [Bacillota bacterium]